MPPGTSPANRKMEGTTLARVLVVEDEESFSDALSYMLRKEGFEVSVAPTGTSALTQFDRTGADIVLLDLMLPEMSGTEVCRQLRQRSAVPIIMVTARDSEIDKVVGLEIGADDYVTKPYSPRELVARIRAVLRRQGAEARRGGHPDAGRRPGPDGRRAARGHRRRRRRAAAAEGVRAARTAAAQRRPGAHPRPADRPGLGRRLRRRHQDPGRARQAAALQSGAGALARRATSSPCGAWATSSSPEGAPPSGPPGESGSRTEPGEWPVHGRPACGRRSP